MTLEPVGRWFSLAHFRPSSLFLGSFSAFPPTSFVVPSKSTSPPPLLQCKLLKLSLGTLFFAYYILPLDNLINDQGFNYHVYRNGTHIYIFTLDSLDSRTMYIATCLLLSRLLLIYFSTPYLSSLF